MGFGERDGPPQGDGGDPRMRPDATFAAANDLVDLIVGYYRNKDGVHAETAIGALAALFGEWSLRAQGGFVLQDRSIFQRQWRLVLQQSVARRLW